MEVTEKQIADWKKKHGAVFMLETEDGKVGYIGDPLQKLTVVKQALQAFASENIMSMAAVYLKNCWLGGDEEIRDVESYANDLAYQIDEIAAFPDCQVERLEACYSLKCEGMELKVRTAMRKDVISAEQRNSEGKALQTNEYLLEMISLDKKKLEDVKQNTRAYLGMIRATNKVKDKIYTSVKKL